MDGAHPRAFLLHLLAYHASRDLVPLYSVYALLFSDHGIGPGEVSLLFVVWSVTSFVCEVPSGAWADTVDRRALLVLAAVVYGAGFATWLVRPGFAGYALGFALWGFSSALMSGTFESLLHDELVHRGRPAAYASVLGWARSAAMVATLAASGLAAVLFHLGGYALVGWTSVALAGVQGILAATLPVSQEARRPPRAEADPLAEVAEESGRYVTMLRSGVREARHHPPVRRVLVLAGLLVGLTAYDEYFPLVARDHGVDTGTTALLVGLTVVGQVVGTALAGVSAARLEGRGVALLVAAGGVLVSVGALLTPYAGFVGIAAGYGMLNNAMLVGEARLQESITGPARATVTSVLGVLEEAVALVVYGTFALGAELVDIPSLVALLGLPVLVVAVSVARWLPVRSEDSGLAGESPYAW